MIGLSRTRGAELTFHTECDGKRITHTYADDHGYMKGRDLELSHCNFSSFVII